MSAAVISPGFLRGSLCPPPSKSEAHRLLIGACLTQGQSRVENIALSDDIRATIRGMEALGASAEPKGTDFCLQGLGTPPAAAEINCMESGSTLRFLIPIAAALGVSARFTGQGRLPLRPMETYRELLPRHGVDVETAGGLPFTIRGALQPGLYSLPGNISSQFITRLLFSLPLLNGDSRIQLTTPLESAGYVEMTLETLKQFGVTVHSAPGGWEIRGGQRYMPGVFQTEPDWSQAAFFLAAGCMGGEIALTGLRPASAQGDRAILEICRRFGGSLSWEEGKLCCGPGLLAGCVVHASQIPDLVPAIAALAAVSKGTTKITGAARLRMKESDRLASMARGLSALGVCVREQADGLTIQGGPVSGGKVDGCGDHRIVMAFSVLATAAAGPVAIIGWESIRKSYPNFYEDFQKLGGRVYVDHSIG